MNQPNHSETKLAGKPTWDVVVIGAGPAGTSAAIRCRQLGLKVLLVDAKDFPREKVCGGCLNQGSITLLQQLISPDNLFWKSAIGLNEFHLHHRHKQFKLPMPAGFAVDRTQMDATLVEVAQSQGVVFEMGVMAKLLPIADPRRQVKLTRQSRVTIVDAACVVIASGLVNHAGSGRHEQDPTSIVGRNSRVGIAADVRNQSAEFLWPTLHMSVAEDGYVGITRMAHDRLHVAAAVDRAALQAKGIGEVVEAILRSAGTIEVDLGKPNWRGTPSLTARSKRVAERQVFLVGDAAAYVEPFTGEGIRWALKSGMGVAPFVALTCTHWHDSLATDWQQWYRQHLAAEQQLCRRISMGLRQPAIRWLAHQVIRFQPRFAQANITHLNRTEI